MPNYRWNAIDFEGHEHKGKQWAPTVKQLENDLLEQNLGLMSASRIKLAWIERLSLEEQVQLFEQLQILLSAGLLLSQALNVLSRYGSRLRCSLARELCQCIKHGSSLIDALNQFPAIINPLALCLIISGQEAGDLPAALRNLVSFLHMQQDIRKKIYAAARVPLVTFAFFCAIVLIIFLAIVPSFEQVLQVTNQTTSRALQRLFALSHLLQSIGLIGLLVLVFAGLGFCYFIGRSRLVNIIKQWLFTHIPVISHAYWSYELAGFFQAVALLIRGGKGLSDAMHLALIVTKNNYIRQRLQLLERSISEGQPLEEAFINTCGQYAKPDITPLLAVGNESGMLAPVLEQSARLLFDYAEQQLNRLALIIQPLLMGLLGLLVALLLYTVYVPIIQLPQTLSATNF